MATINISKKKTKLIDEYYDNITLVKVYKCFCGKGKIIEEDVRGFNDHYAYLECPECEKKYSSYLDFTHTDWIVDENIDEEFDEELD